MNTHRINQPTLNIEAHYQHPADLELGIFTGEIPVALTILAKTVLTVRDWRLTLHIIGESHFVRVERAGELVLQEVLACIQLPSAKCSHHQRFSNLQPHHYQREGYTVNVTFDTTWQTEPPAAPILSLEFPAIYGQIPVTQIHLALTDESARWWTLHLYPDEGHITTVRTFSELSLHL